MPSRDNDPPELRKQLGASLSVVAETALRIAWKVEKKLGETDGVIEKLQGRVDGIDHGLAITNHQVKLVGARVDNLEGRIMASLGRIEDRRILLLDEWAADQDPEFREHFYRSMLPRLRAAGRTVIAVTNDDRYYDVADQVLRLEDGALVP